MKPCEPDIRIPNLRRGRMRYDDIIRIKNPSQGNAKAVPGRWVRPLVGSAATTLSTEWLATQIGIRSPKSLECLKQEGVFTKCGCKLGAVSKELADPKKIHKTIPKNFMHFMTMYQQMGIENRKAIAIDPLKTTAQIPMKKPSLVSKYVQTEQLSEASKGVILKPKLEKIICRENQSPQREEPKPEDTIRVTKQSCQQIVKSHKKVEKKQVSGHRIKGEASWIKTTAGDSYADILK